MERQTERHRESNRQTDRERGGRGEREREREGGREREFVCFLVGCLTSQQQASVSQGRITVY